MTNPDGVSALVRRARAFQEGARKLYDQSPGDMWFFELFHFMNDIEDALSRSPSVRVDDESLERGLVAVCNHRRARYHLPPMTLEALKTSEGPHWPLLIEETRVAFTAALTKGPVA